MAATCWFAPATRAQDAAVEERLNKLSGQIEDLLAAQAEQQKRIAALAREIDSLHEQQNQAGGNYASQEDLRKLADKLQELDKNRQADKELILKEIEKLGKAAATPAHIKKTAPDVTPTPASGGSAAATGPEKGYEYVIQSGDTLSSVAQAYREKNIKVTVDQILKANPGLNANKLKVGQKIFIPAPPQ